MQIPLWAFLTTLVVALAWKEMASFLVKRPLALFTSSAIKSYLPTISHNFPKSIPHNILKSSPHIRHFSNPSTNMSSQAFLDAVTARRSYYQLKKESPIEDKKIQEIVETALLQVPSSFNSQSTRVILLLKAEHDKFWGMVYDTLKAIVPEDKFSSTETRINGFKAGYGTVRSSFLLYLL